MNESPDKDSVWNKAKKVITRPFQPTERSERDTKSKSSVMDAFTFATNEQEVIAGLDEILNQHEKPAKPKEHKRHRDKEKENGTWPKCRTYNVNDYNVTKKERERPQLEGVMLGVEPPRYADSGGGVGVRGPPTPPERSDSFKRSASIKHSPQSSDASACSVKYNPQYNAGGTAPTSQAVSSSSTATYSSHMPTSNTSTQSQSTPQRGVGTSIQTSSYPQTTAPAMPPPPKYTAPTAPDRTKHKVTSSSQSSVASSHTGGFGENVGAFGNNKSNYHPRTSTMESSTASQSSNGSINIPDYTVVSGHMSHMKYMPQRSRPRQRPERPTSAPSRTKREKKVSENVFMNYAYVKIICLYNYIVCINLDVLRQQ